MECKDKTEVVCVGIVPSKICFTVPRDTDSAFVCILTDQNKVPVDIRLDAVRFTVKDGYGGNVKLNYQNDASSHIDGENGKTEFTITKADIKIVTIPVDEMKQWKYEIRRIQPDNKEALHITGDFIVQPTVGGP